jgi:LmbE family N-acetylglucosaminyl deacetylase
MSPMEPLRLLSVLAHPDDESLGFGGTLAYYSAQGVELSLITATLGQKGRYRGQRDGPDHPGIEGLGRIREAELRAAAAILGVRDLSLLGYMDGVLDRVDPIEAIARIAHHLRRLRPQVVLTFPPDGAYGHPDHVAISQLTSAAIVAAADPHHGNADGALPPHAVAKLYFLVGSQASFDAYQAAVVTLRSMVDGVERKAVAWPEWLITTTLDTRAHQQTVWQAVMCHESQVSGYQRMLALSPDQRAELWGTARWYRSFSTVNGGRGPETDLFEGLRG